MYPEKRLDKVCKQAFTLTLGREVPVVFMSDCHRGTGSGADNFAKNQNLFHVALRHYDNSGYVYIELGDGDELWENRKFCPIANEYDHIFARLSKLYREGRFYMLYGNHDRVKQNERWVEQVLARRWDHFGHSSYSLFPNMQVYESIRLGFEGLEETLLLLHGHQADFFNDRLGGVAKYLVRYVWKSLELLGMKDPLNTAANPERRLKVEQKLAAWSQKRGQIVVAGHTHRPVFPKPGEAPYFNDGSCVHPRFITALELVQGRLSLVRWGVKTKPDGTLYVARENTDGPIALEAYGKGKGVGEIAVPAMG